VSGARFRVLVDGEARGELLHLSEPLSLWGGLDPETGLIIDRSHPQVGRSMTGVIVSMPHGRGSSSSSSVHGDREERARGAAWLPPPGDGSRYKRMMAHIDPDAPTDEEVIQALRERARERGHRQEVDAIGGRGFLAARKDPVAQRRPSSA